MDPTTAAIILLAVLVVLLFAAGAGLLRRVRELELAVYRGVGRSVTGLQPGGAPQIASDGSVSIVAKLVRRCPSCLDVAHAMAEQAGAQGDGIKFVIVADGGDYAAEAGGDVRVIDDPGLWRSLDVPFAPALLLVDGSGTIVNTAPAGSGAVVAEFVRQAAGLGRVGTA